ncbi:MAG: hypothetical protein IH589_10405 [Anaerolineales bacterium]|nr:hypothetical protein [Anaerolineales bacterium]
MEPWGSCSRPHGKVYVANTWNHQVQKFYVDGKFLSNFDYVRQG